MAGRNKKETVPSRTSKGSRRRPESLKTERFEKNRKNKKGGREPASLDGKVSARTRMGAGGTKNHNRPRSL